MAFERSSSADTADFTRGRTNFFKNTQAEICPEIKNKLRTITRLKFLDQKNLRNLFNPCAQIEMYMNTKLVKI